MVSTGGSRSAELSALEMAAWTGLLRAHSSITRLLDRELQAECGLTLAQYDVLVQLANAADRRLRMTELAEVVLLSPSGLTRLVDRLVILGLLERRACPSDARGTYAVLTAVGRNRLRVASAVHLRGVREHVTGRLDEAQLRGLAETTQRLRTSAEAAEN